MWETIAIQSSKMSQGWHLKPPPKKAQNKSPKLHWFWDLFWEFYYFY